MKQRILTALVLLVIFIPILFLGGSPFNLFVILIGILGLKEMIDIRDLKYKVPIIIKLIAFGAFIYLATTITATNEFTYLLDYRILSFIIILFLVPIILYHDNDIYNINDALFLIGTIFFLGISFNLLIILREQSLARLLYLIIITTVSDTYALLGGMLIGRHKLIESISPKKTREGLFVGTFFGVLIASVYYFIIINNSINIFYLIICTTILSLIGQAGDLVFSSIKRLYNKKDFSNLMPGHGGILDRLDSFIFVILGYILLMFVI